MPERQIALDPAEVHAEENTQLQQAIERAQRAEEELARLRSEQIQPVPPEQRTAVQQAGTLSEKQPPSPSTAEALQQDDIFPDPIQPKGEPSGGIEELRKDSMMAHLLDHSMQEKTSVTMVASSSPWSLATSSRMKTF